MKKFTVVAHDEAFHADDIFAVATLSILLGPKNIEIIRSRDPLIQSKADYVVDTGGVYDSLKNRFDHHQEGGAGVRDNGVPYAAFGLVWKSYGEKICGSKEVADAIEQKLVMPLDAHDNGVELSSSLIQGVRPYILQQIFFTFDPTWKETTTRDEAFMELVPFARILLEREIKITQDALEAKTKVDKIYENSGDKRVLILDIKYPWQVAVQNYPELLFVIYPNKKQWRSRVIQKDPGSFEAKKYFPESWAGKVDAELAAITGVPDANFCHNKRFTIGATSKEGVIAMVQRALDA